MPLFPPFVHTEQIMCSTKMSKLPAGITQSGSTCGFSVLWQDLYLIFYFLFCSLFEDNKCNKKHLLSLAAEHLFIWNWAIFRTVGRGLLLIMKAEILLRSQHIRFEVLFLSQRACPSVSGNKCQLEHTKSRFWQTYVFLFLLRAPSAVWGSRLSKHFLL